MIAFSGLRAPEPLAQTIPTDWNEVRRPFQTLSPQLAYRSI